MSDTWNPAQYHRFQAERRQPFDDLLGLIEPVPGGRVVDYGCGSGELTAALHGHVGAAETTGVDSSAAMLSEAAGHAGDGLSFVEADLAAWAPPWSADVITANASIQWVPGHPELLARWRNQLAPGGQLAVQVPANFDHPSHTVAEEVGLRYELDPIDRFEAVLAPERYAELLDGLGFDPVHVRLQVYLHHLPTTDSLVEWVRGTLLTRYQRDLGEERFAGFLRDYREALLAAVGDPSGGRPYLFTFKRILMAARLPA